MIARTVRSGGLFLLKSKSAALVIKALVSVILLLYLSTRVSLPDVGKLFAGVNLFWLLLGLCFMVGGVVVSSWKWRAILLVDNVDCPLRVLFKIYLIGIFFNNFLPTSIGGDAIRGYYLSRQCGSSVVGVSSILAERMSGFFVLLLFPFIGFMLSTGFDRKSFPALLFFLLLFLIVTLACFLFPPIRNRWGSLLPNQISATVVNLSEAMGRYLQCARARSAMLIGSVIFNGLVLLTHWSLARALHMDLAFADLMIVVPLVIILTLIPLSLNGLGVREGGFVFFLTGLGVGQAEALSFGLLSYALLVIVSLSGGAAFGWGRLR
jgi:uncharacterized protein (TIRG00374 family)